MTLDLRFICMSACFFGKNECRMILLKTAGTGSWENEVLYSLCINDFHGLKVEFAVQNKGALTYALRQKLVS